ncbi:aminotransferase-like domain-containing protein [Streptomyces jumonjinensis]|uniref:PLP-dependent aminotransferase family protein n=1 Tax=Streptomyces jumonjinensis TaxID=1945 RepID=A0A646KRN2_STRJU|nr:PLP-dependent aminotransferase family protein [Streptomyces jumonjinensis]MQT04760.1 PLP-dependent aminotransferase family protein [Streptomyces jumonjinensis]
MQSDEPSRPGSRVDPWRGHYAARAAGMVASEVRALFAVASRPEIVSLAGGMPNVAALPMDALGALMAELVAERGAVALQYGSAQGDLGLRETICEVMAAEGIDGHPDDVVVTVGSQQALDLVTRVFVDPGDTVVTEAPTYVTAIGVLAAYQANVVHVAMDDAGVVPEALAETFARLAREGRPAKLFYTVPTFQNPAGVTLTEERRPRVVEVCRRAGVLVLEDNPYGLLHLDADKPLRALRADAPADVIYLGSFSKTLAPGLRVGWALAPAAVREKLVLAAESAMLSHAVFNQLAVDRYMRTQPWPEQLGNFREMYRERRGAMLDALEKYMPPGVSWTRPAGGFFVWVTLPEGLDSKAMLPRAIQSRVAYVPGTGFYANGDGRQAMRLSYCYPPPERINDGVRRLADVIGAEVRLRDTFGTSARADSTGPQAPGPDQA